MAPTLVHAAAAARPVSKAIVATLQRRLGEIDPGETKMALFLALYCLFTRLHVRVRLLKTQLTQAFHCPGISQRG